jgi:hypothetical protein
MWTCFVSYYDIFMGFVHIEASQKPQQNAPPSLLVVVEEIWLRQHATYLLKIA